MNSQQVQLLVSIRNPQEILPAIQGGCNILDLKEPLNGPLAMVDESTVHSICEFYRSHSVAVPVSMALGELIDWNQKNASLVLPNEVTYLKMGLSQTAVNQNWFEDWINLRKQIEKINKKTYQWIAVAYADWEQANAVSPEVILTAAISSKCTGILIDTYTKQGQSLLDFLSLRKIKLLIKQARSQQLIVALAGSIDQKNLVSLADIGPDIIGIRGAACRGALRTNSVEEQAVRKFREQLDYQSTLPESG